MHQQDWRHYIVHALCLCLHFFISGIIRRFSERRVHANKVTIKGKDFTCDAKFYSREKNFSFFRTARPLLVLAAPLCSFPPAINLRGVVKYTWELIASCYTPPSSCITRMFASLWVLDRSIVQILLEYLEYEHCHTYLHFFHLFSTTRKQVNFPHFIQKE